MCGLRWAFSRIQWPWNGQHSEAKITLYASSASASARKTAVYSPCRQNCAIGKPKGWLVCYPISGAWSEFQAQCRKRAHLTNFTSEIAFTKKSKLFNLKIFSPSIRHLCQPVYRSARLGRSMTRQPPKAGCLLIRNFRVHSTFNDHRPCAASNEYETHVFKKREYFRGFRFTM